MSDLNLMGRWRWKHREAVAAGVTTRTMRSPEVARDKVRRVRRVMIQNEDSAGSVCVISIERAFERHEIYHQTLTTAARYYPVAVDVLLFGEDRLRYDFSSCTAADDLYIREVGETYEAPEGLF